MNCPTCNTAIQPHWDFCQECGTPAARPAPDAVPNGSTATDSPADGSPADLARDNIWASVPPHVLMGHDPGACNNDIRVGTASWPAARVARRAAYEFQRHTAPMRLVHAPTLLPGRIEMLNDEFLVELGPEWGRTGRELTLTTYRLFLPRVQNHAGQHIVYLTRLRGVSEYRGPFGKRQLVLDTDDGKLRVPLAGRADIAHIQQELMALVTWTRRRVQAPTMPLAAQYTIPPPRVRADGAKHAHHEEKEEGGGEIKEFAKSALERFIPKKPEIKAPSAHNPTPPRL